MVTLPTIIPGSTPGFTPDTDEGPAASTPAEPGDSVQLWIDTHVHLHGQHDAEILLDGAAAHFAGAGVGVLCLTEVLGAQGFERLADVGVVGRWRIEKNGEFALVAKRGDGAIIGLIAGRQIKCDDGLEVAVIGRPVEIADGLTLNDSIEAARGNGALVMLCYGVGKWSGPRGAKVRAVLEDGPSEIAFGDNSGRVGLGEQAILKRARKLGRTVLVGSDPLHIDMARQRAGCWGVIVAVPGGATFDAGWADRVVDALRRVGPKPATFGSRVSCVTAVAQQIGVRLP